VDVTADDRRPGLRRVAALIKKAPKPTSPLTPGHEHKWWYWWKAADLHMRQLTEEQREAARQAYQDECFESVMEDETGQSSPRNREG
jgi:hypothetical protein